MNQLKKADQYNDATYDYRRYWDERQYEHQSEVIAIQRLLKGRHFYHAIDIGGGYGRLSIVLTSFAERVTLAEPSQQQLDYAADFLKDYPQVDRKLMQADKLDFKDEAIDLAVMVRVMHHLPDPSNEFSEISRVLSKNGVFILEVANFVHARNRLKYFVTGKKLPSEPVDIRSLKNRREGEVAFVNHNPKTVVKQLAHAGLKVDKVLSVSNLRSPGLKKVVPKTIMLSLEKIMQLTLAKVTFGPSVFFLVKKAN